LIPHGALAALARMPDGASAQDEISIADQRQASSSRLALRSGLRAEPACVPTSWPCERLRSSRGPSSRTAFRRTAAVSSRERRLRAASSSSGLEGLGRRCFRERELAEEPPFENDWLRPHKSCSLLADCQMPMGHAPRLLEVGAKLAEFAELQQELRRLTTGRSTIFALRSAKSVSLL
jgi:hypothetical protein